MLVEPLLALLDEQVELDGAGGAVVAQHQQLGAAQLEGLHLGQELRHGFLGLASGASNTNDLRGLGSYLPLMGKKYLS